MRTLSREGNQRPWGKMMHNKCVNTVRVAHSTRNPLRELLACYAQRYTQRLVAASLCGMVCSGCVTTGQDLYVACSLSPADGWSHLDREPDGAADMRSSVASRIAEARSEGRRRLEWFANTDGQLALCATYPRPDFCFTETYNFAKRDGAWTNIDDPNEFAAVVCT